MWEEIFGSSNIAQFCLKPFKHLIRYGFKLLFFQICLIQHDKNENMSSYVLSHPTYTSHLPVLGNVFLFSRSRLPALFSNILHLSEAKLEKAVVPESCNNNIFRFNTCIQNDGYWIEFYIQIFAYF